MTEPTGGVVNWRGVAIGALVAGAVALPVSLLAPEDRDANTNLILFAIIVAGLVLGGFAAGRSAPDYALTNGAIAPTLMYVVVQGIGVIRHLATGDRVNVFSIVFNLFLSASCGVVGGAIAYRASRRRPAEQTASTPEVDQ